MKNRIVADGHDRLLDGQRAIRSIFPGKKHPAEQTTARADGKDQIDQRAEEELRRHQKMVNHKPSAGALWLAS